jgi:hypothetical protein
VENIFPCSLFVGHKEMHEENFHPKRGTFSFSSRLVDAPLLENGDS